MSAKECEICGAETTFERKNRTEPHEGEVCSICDKWICNDCVDYSYMAEVETVDPICIRCSKRGEQKMSEKVCPICGNNEWVHDPLDNVDVCINCGYDGNKMQFKVVCPACKHQSAAASFIEDLSDSTTVFQEGNSERETEITITCPECEYTEDIHPTLR